MAGNRQLRAVRLNRIAGYLKQYPLSSDEDIAGELGIPVALAGRLRRQLHDEWGRQRAYAIEPMIRAEVENLQGLETQIKTMIVAAEEDADKIGAMNTYLRLMQRRAKLMGLDASRKVEVSMALPPRPVRTAKAFDADGFNKLIDQMMPQIGAAGMVEGQIVTEVVDDAD